MSSPLFENYRREATTYAGNLQLNYERALLMTTAYGVMYASMRYGMAFSRVKYERCAVQELTCQ